MQNFHSASESSLKTVPYSDQVSCKPKPKKRHRKGKGVLRRKNKRKMESCDNGEELPNTEINEVSEPRELSPKSNSFIHSFIHFCKIAVDRMHGQNNRYGLINVLVN